MKVNNCELIEKWGFWLALYTFASIFLEGFLFNLLPPDIANNSTGILLRCVLFALILLPCFMGGVFYLFLGAKFRSPIYLSVGLSSLIMVVFLGTFFYLPTSFFQENSLKFYGVIIFISCCLSVARRHRIKFENNVPIEKWGIRLAVFTMCVPLLALPVIIFSHLLPESFATRNYLMYLFLVLMVPSIVGGLFYLGVGAKFKSFKFASAGLSSLLLSFQNVVMLFFVFSLLLDLVKH